MKNIFIFMWGMLIASGWWGVGLIKYNDGFNDDTLILAIPLLLLMAGSILTACYIVVKFGSCIYRCWND